MQTLCRARRDGTRLYVHGPSAVVDPAFFHMFPGLVSPWIKVFGRFSSRKSNRSLVSFAASPARALTRHAKPRNRRLAEREYQQRTLTQGPLGPFYLDGCVHLAAASMSYSHSSVLPGSYIYVDGCALMYVRTVRRHLFAQRQKLLPLRPPLCPLHNIITNDIIHHHFSSHFLDMWLS